MYEFAENETWEDTVLALRKHLDIEPKPVKECAKENIYLTNPGKTLCFDMHLMFRGLVMKVKKLQIENDEQKEVIRKQAGWLASKELQTSMLARLEHLEKKMKVKD